MSISPKLPKIACVVAFVMAALIVIGALLSSIVIAPMALVPLCAAVGIMRRRVWSAYGFGLYQFAQIPLIPVVLLRQGHSATSVPGLLTSALFSLCLGTLFCLAGRALANADGVRGRMLPWIVVAALTTLPLLFVQPFVIPTGAMEDTILVGDRILALRFPRPEPARGDVVVFAYPVDRNQTFVKRVIGMSGDRIRISAKVVYRNGSPLKEPYVVHKTEYEDSYRDDFPRASPIRPSIRKPRKVLAKNVVNGEVVVPPQKYFVMGDNRDMSLDSRYWGFVDAGDIIGKPLLIYDSQEETTEQLLTSQNAFRPHRTRWNRIIQATVDDEKPLHCGSQGEPFEPHPQPLRVPRREYRGCCFRGQSVSRESITSPDAPGFP